MQCDNCYVCVYLCLYSLSNLFFLFPFLCVLYELQCLTSNKNIFHPPPKKKKKKDEFKDFLYCKKLEFKHKLMKVSYK